MHRAERVERGAREALDVGGLRHVGRLRGDCEPARSQLGRGARERGLVDVREHELHALAAEALGERTPEARCAAGDDRDAVREGFHE